MSSVPNLGEFEQVVLLAILQHRSNEAYGVSIREKIAAHTRRDPTPGAIYTTLDRLERKKLVRSNVGEATPQRGGRAKRYYQVTSVGITALRRARQEFQNLARGLSVLGET
jgi:DNA-binding PadR family transcriptional regulator